jgi:hypothetical protein
VYQLNKYREPRNGLPVFYETGIEALFNFIGTVYPAAGGALLYIVNFIEEVKKKRFK